MYKPNKYSGHSAFWITKPLQLMVALSISQQESWENKPTFIIIDSFSGANSVAGKLIETFSELQTPIYAATRNSGLSFLLKNKFSNIFFDSDVGVKNFAAHAFQKILNPNLSIYIYEEGVGTYSTGLYSGAKKRLLQTVGIGTFFGGSRLTSSIYTYHPAEYLCKHNAKIRSTIEINQKLADFLRVNLDALNYLFGFSDVCVNARKTAQCALYLSNWQVDAEFISFFNKLPFDRFIKPHPHIREVTHYEGVHSISADIPAELLIIKLMKQYQSVLVYDHNSSVRRYISGGNVTYVAVRT